MTAVMLPLPATDGFVPCGMDEANDLLVRWAHKLGPINRPFRSDGWLFLVDGVPVSVAVTASIVSSHISDDDGNPLYRRTEVVELARLASCECWANRLMLRWWREVGALRWPCWSVKAAVSYHHEGLHTGDLYRFDGWRKVRSGCGSSGGGTWSSQRGAADAVTGPKSLWLWKYQPSALDRALADREASMLAAEAAAIRDEAPRLNSSGAP